MGPDFLPLTLESLSQVAGGAVDDHQDQGRDRPRKQPSPAGIPLHEVPRPAFPTSEPASIQRLSESGQEAIVAEVLEAAGAATCREKLQHPFRRGRVQGAALAGLRGLRAGQQLPDQAGSSPPDPKTSDSAGQYLSCKSEPVGGQRSLPVPRTNSALGN